MDRPPPPITVSIPGRGDAPAELLAVGPPPPRRAPWSSRRRLTGLAALALLAAAVLTALADDPAPPAPRRLPVVPAVPGLVAQVATGRLPAPGPLVASLVLLVTTSPAGGRGDSGSPTADDEVELLDVTARGFVVTVVGGRLPQPVPVDRLGTSLLLDLEARVVDCSLDVQAPRAVSVQVRRGDGPPAALRASGGPEVVRALDRLVSQSCRRPRG